MAFLPHVITSTDGNEYNTDLISYDMIKNRVIYLNGEVNGESAISVITQLRYLAAKSDKDIYLFINSPGGAVSDEFIKNNIPCALNAGVEINGYKPVAFEDLFTNNSIHYEREVACPK